MKKFLLVSLLLFVGMSSAFASDTEDVKNILQDINQDLNHQNMQSALQKSDALFSQYSDDFLAKNLSYTDFVSVLQILLDKLSNTSSSSSNVSTADHVINTSTLDMQHFITLRAQYYPKELSGASILAGNTGVVYTPDCKGRILSFQDKIVYTFCKFYSKKELREEEIKQFLNVGKRLANIALRSRNSQNMSDAGNFLLVLPDVWYTGADTGRNVLITRLGNEILKQDPHWVNAYLLFIGGTNDKKKQMEYAKQLKQNYLGDKDYWDNVILPLLKHYDITLE